MSAVSQPVDNANPRRPDPVSEVAPESSLSSPRPPQPRSHSASSAITTATASTDSTTDDDDDDDDDDPSIPSPVMPGVEDQDGVHAVLQPAMSAAASHLTSPHTPATEKAAALEKSGGILADAPLPEEDEDKAGPASPQVGSPPSPAHKPTSPRDRGMHLGQLPQSRLLNKGGPANAAPLPSPWHAEPKSLVVDKNAPSRGVPPAAAPSSSNKASTRLPSSRAVLESAFGPTTRHRSRSAGQEALRRLSKAFPSFSTPSHLLPSFGSSFFSSSSSPSSPGEKSPLSPRRPPYASGRALSSDPSLRTNSLPQASGTPRARHHATSTPFLSRTIQQQPAPSAAPGRPVVQPSASASASASRPPILRRVTSDESILYHSLSRASSLGDDDQFQDVRAMVNMRLQAFKESLPERPNFRMPSLPRRIHAPSFKSMNPYSSHSSMAATADGDAARHRSSSVETTTATPTHNAAAAAAALKEGHGELDAALEDLTGDIVVMGGLRGSVLRSAEPPHHQCWAPVKLGFNMRKVNLEVGLEEEDEERMEESIIASGMLSHIGPIDISRRLIKRLRHCKNARTGKLRVWDYGYDWRLSPHMLSRKLQEFLATLPSNQTETETEARGALVIAHSLGGMITRHAVNQRPELFSGVLYAGVPQRCINILGPLRNGDVVLLNEKLLSAQVNFSMRTSFVFLPEDGFCFVDKDTHESYPIDFFDPQEWARWHLSPCARLPLPALAGEQQQQQQQAPGSPSLSSFLPNSLRTRAESRSEKWFGSEPTPNTTATATATATTTTTKQPGTSPNAGHKDRTLAPQLQPGSNKNDNTSSDPSSPPPSHPDRARNMAYLARILPQIRRFRSETLHLEAHQSANRYPPLAVMYGKSTPTVYAAQVRGREGIPCADAYDDLLFRAGDGVVLAREAMLPEGYAVVRGGRVSTERGHITMLGDLEAVGRAVRALMRGRRKGIGLGDKEDSEGV